jgi:hypothetical protein
MCVILYFEFMGITSCEIIISALKNQKKEKASLAIRSYTRAFTKMDGVRDLGGALSVCVGPEKAFTRGNPCHSVKWSS